jgi:hypothetical protein
VTSRGDDHLCAVFRNRELRGLWELHSVWQRECESNRLCMGGLGYVARGLDRAKHHRASRDREECSDEDDEKQP